MALAAPLEDFCEALVGSKGLKRLVKCSNKRSRENHSNGRDVNESRPIDAKRQKTGLKLKIKLNGNVVASRAATPQTELRQAEFLARAMPAGRQAELDAFGMPDSRLLKAFQPTWCPTESRGSAPSLQAGELSADKQDTHLNGARVLPAVAQQDQTLQESSPQQLKSAHEKEVGEARIAKRSPSSEARGTEAAGKMPAKAAPFGNPLPFLPPAQQAGSDAGAKSPELGALHGRKESQESPRAQQRSQEGCKDSASIEQMDSLAVFLPAEHEADIPSAAGAGGGQSKQDVQNYKTAHQPDEGNFGLQEAQVAGQGEERQTAVDVKQLSVTEPQQGREALLQPVVESNQRETSGAVKSEGKPKDTGLAAEEGEFATQDAGSRRAQSPSGLSRGTSSSSSSSTDTSDSDSGSASLERKRKAKRLRSPSPSPARSRSREAGEYSADEYPAGQRPSRQSSPEQRSRPKGSLYRDRSRGRAGYDERSGSRRHRYEYGREYDRDRREAGRMSAERKTRRRKDEERRKDGDNTRHRRRRSEERERISQRRSPRAQRERPSGLDADNKPSKAERSSQTFSAGSPRRAEEPPRTESKDLTKETHHQDAGPEDQGALFKRSQGRWGRGQAQPAANVKPIGFADAWNMLHGSGRETCGDDAEIDELHSAATNAKRSIENLSKATNGKHTFENLVALMRDSYLKYMQVGAIWEAMIRMPNANPNRNRAKLADEGGMFPQTITLMRQIAADCRTCPANTEASKILRCLAERLSAIIQMRIVHIQRAKVAQDRQILLSCKGAPKVDAYGRKLPDADLPGETYQRPSPTDSNASNNTSEQAVHQTPSPSYARSLQAKQPMPSARAGVTASLSTSAQQNRGAKGAKPALERRPTPGLPRVDPGKAGKVRRTTPVPLGSGRDDAWAVEPLPWEILPKHFDSEMRAWNVLGGFMTFTAAFKSQVSEIEGLMQINNENVREAAGMLGFLDLGIGLTNMGVVLQMSQEILALVLKIQSSSPDKSLLS